jgi:glycosyltransferase involved in cell wall biosynthesis
MNIVFYFPGSLPVARYGGTERVVYWLMKELARENRVTLIGNPASDVRSINVSLIPCQNGTDWRTLIPADTDVVHTTLNSLDIDKPYVNTIHGNEAPGTVFPMNSVFVSKNHAQRHGSDQYVYNGLDLDEYPLARHKKKSNDTYSFLANGRWNVKNLYDCIRVCSDCGKSLLVGGAARKDVFGVFRNAGKPAYSAIPHFLSPKIHYYGMIQQTKKLSFFSRSDYFLWPVRWNEPFGLAVIEAFSQGVPVYASPYGSLPEIVPDFCGSIVRSYDELHECVRDSQRIFIEGEIRNYCVEKFSSSVMSKNYMRLYDRVISGETLNSIPPFVANNATPLTLLPF